MIIDDIRASFKTYNPSTVVSYGRPADTAIASAKLEIDEWFAHIDPIRVDGKAIDNNLSSPITIGILKQDKPDSQFDQEENLDIDPSIEEIQKEAQTFVLGWYNHFMDEYGNRYSNDAYSIVPATRIKNVMSGILFTGTFSYKGTC